MANARRGPKPMRDKRILTLYDKGYSMARICDEVGRSKDFVVEYLEHRGYYVSGADKKNGLRSATVRGQQYRRSDSITSREVHSLMAQWSRP